MEQIEKIEKATAILNDINAYSKDRANAAIELGEFGSDEVVTTLIYWLRKDYDNDFTFNVRRACAIALGRIGHPRALGPLIDSLKNDTNLGVIEAIPIALGTFGDLSVIEELIDLVKNDTDYNVRRYAASSLCALGDLRAFEVLVEAVKNDSSKVRGTVIYNLHKIKDPRVCDVLIDVLQHKNNQEHRKYAAISLGKLGDSSAIEPLLEALRKEEEHVDVKYSASEAIAEIGDLRAIEPLAEIIDNHTDDKTRQYASDALDQIKSQKK